MIQRIQTLYLLAVVALGIALIWLPVLQFTTPDGQLYSLTALGGAPLQGLWGLTLTTILIPLMALIDIFLFKKRLLQARLNIFSVMLCLGYYGIMGIYVWHCKANLHFDPLNWHMTASMMIPVICFVLTLMATRRILKDEALVRAADRIR